MDDGAINYFSDEDISYNAIYVCIGFCPRVRHIS